MCFHADRRLSRLKPLQTAGKCLLALTSAVVLLTGVPTPAQAECSTDRLSKPTRQLVRCNGTLRIEREAGTGFKIFERSGDEPPRAIELEGGAILIEVPPGSRPTQIRTPHAIAAVRGTTYVVDAGAAETSVFVLKGAVTVSKLAGGGSVTLQAGEGADVRATAPLTVKTWGAQRVANLLARFGR